MRWDKLHSCTMSQVAAIYARVSKNDPNTPKVQNQETDCRALAAELGVEVTAVFVDDGVSATKGKQRPGFDDLVTRVARGEFDIILAKEQSRFERSPIDRERLAMASVTTGTQWHTVFEKAIDPADADDEFMSVIRSGQNRAESRRIARRVRAANDHVVASGKPLTTKRPFGFERDGVTIRESEAEALRWAVDHVLDGGSMWAVIKEWSAKGITPVIPRTELERAEKEGRTPRTRIWSYGSLGSLLKRPRNAGLVVHRGEVVREGDFEGIISREKYDLLQAVISDPSRSVVISREPKHLMSGVALCGECDQPLRSGTTETKTKGGVKRRYPIYRCTNPGKAPGTRHASIKMGTLDEAVPVRVLPALFEAVSRGEMKEAATERVAPLLAQRAELETKRTNVQELALMPNANMQHVRKMLDDIEAEASTLRDRITAARASSLGALAGLARDMVNAMAEYVAEAVERGGLDTAPLLQDALTTGALFREHWAALPLEDKRNLIRALLVVRVNPASAVQKLAIRTDPETGGSEFVEVRPGKQRIEFIPVRSS